MDVWGTILLGINILLLLAGWLLFQQAKSDLTARAAQVPVLGEVKALQKSIATLLEQLKMESIQTSAQLDARCAEARDLLAAIERRLEEAQDLPPRPARMRLTRGRPSEMAGANSPEPAASAPETPGPETRPAEADPRKMQVYALSDEGTSSAEIARQTGFSQGEVDLILGLRPRSS